MITREKTRDIIALVKFSNQAHGAYNKKDLSNVTMLRSINTRCLGSNPTYASNLEKLLEIYLPPKSQ